MAEKLKVHMNPEEIEKEELKNFLKTIGKVLQDDEIAPREGIHEKQLYRFILDLSTIKILSNPLLPKDFLISWKRLLGGIGKIGDNMKNGKPSASTTKILHHDSQDFKSESNIVSFVSKNNTPHEFSNSTFSIIAIKGEVPVNKILVTTDFAPLAPRGDSEHVTMWPKSKKLKDTKQFSPEDSAKLSFVVGFALKNLAKGLVAYEFNKFDKRIISSSENEGITILSEKVVSKTEEPLENLKKTLEEEYKNRFNTNFNAKKNTLEVTLQKGKYIYCKITPHLGEPDEIYNPNRYEIKITYKNIKHNNRIKNDVYALINKIFDLEFVPPKKEKNPTKTEKRKNWISKKVSELVTKKLSKK
jgi:hypothetical protein